MMKALQISTHFFTVIIDSGSGARNSCVRLDVITDSEKIRNIPEIFRQCIVNKQIIT
jgi:hypothetical protein